MTTPSPFELGRSIGGNIAGGIQQAQETSAIDKILQQANESGDPQQIRNVMGQILQRVAPERQQVASQILANKMQELQARRTQKAQFEAYQQAGLNPNLPESINKEILKGKGKQSVPDAREIGQKSFNNLAEILKKGNIGRGAKAKALFGGKTAEDVGAFESASGGLEAMLVDMVSRGTLSNARFKYITETLLPKPNDTDARIRGKLKSLADLLQLDATVLEGSKAREMSGKQIESLTPENAAEFTGKRVIGEDGKIYRSNGASWELE